MILLTSSAFLPWDYKESALGLLELVVWFGFFIKKKLQVVLSGV